MRKLQYGFRADWALVMPTQKLIPPFFLTAMQPFKNAEGENSSKVTKGAGWSLNDVKKFLGQRMYVIPCGAVDKSDDPHSRIIHNYRYLSKKSASIMLVKTSVSYITFHKRVSELSKVDRYINADQKNSYRQLPVHAADWHSL